MRQRILNSTLAFVAHSAPHDTPTLLQDKTLQNLRGVGGERGVRYTPYTRKQIIHAVKEHQHKNNKTRLSLSQ